CVTDVVSGILIGSNTKLPIYTPFGLQVDELLRNDPIRLPIGPMTLARAKKFKEALVGLIQQFWVEQVKINHYLADDKDPSPCNILHEEL
ncbi:hypothetical protein J1N35_014446, partial [Gossypium stocksii]